MINNHEFDTFATKCARHNQPLRYVLFKNDFIKLDIKVPDRVKQSSIDKNIKFGCDSCPIKK